MKERVIAQLLLFGIGLPLFAFSIEMPVLGYKKLEMNEEGGYEVISYRFYGETIKREAFTGDSEEALDIFQKQVRLQSLQAAVLFFAIASLVLWWAKEKKRLIYGSSVLSILLLVIDVSLVITFN